MCMNKLSLNEQLDQDARSAQTRKFCPGSTISLHGTRTLSKTGTQQKIYPCALQRSFLAINHGGGCARMATSNSAQFLIGSRPEGAALVHPTNESGRAPRSQFSSTVANLD